MELQSRPEALALDLARHQVGGPGGGSRDPSPAVPYLLAGSAGRKVPEGDPFLSLPPEREK